MWSRLSLLVGFLIWRLHIKEFIQGNSLCNNLSTRIGNLALFIVALLPRLWTRQPCSPQGLCSSWTCRALPPHTCICLVVTFSGRPACLASPTITVSQVLYCTFLFSLKHTVSDIDNYCLSPPYARIWTPWEQGFVCFWSLGSMKYIEYYLAYRRDLIIIRWMNK